MNARVAAHPDLSTASSSAPPGPALSIVERAVRTTSDVGPLVARVALGLVMFPHGAQKVLGWFGGYGLSGTMHAFTTQMGIPAVFAALAIAAEFLGSLGLITGTLSRVAAFGVASVMVVATLMVHIGNGFFMNWTGAQAGEGFEYHLLAVALAVVVMVKGGGAYSLDRLIDKKLTQG
jgi:putative oxidoreductase